MINKVKSEWKTYEEMSPTEQLDFRIHNGLKLYQRRLKTITKYRTRIYEYLVETWIKDHV